MSKKRKKVTWQVIASIEGRQWPISVETDIPASSTQEMNGALENVSLWFLKNNIYPQEFTVPPATPLLPNEDGPMPEKDAIPLVGAPVCPHCKKQMIESKHQQSDTEISHYCPTRFGNGTYCKWRGFTNPTTGESDTWPVKKREEEE